MNRQTPTVSRASQPIGDVTRMSMSSCSGDDNRSRAALVKSDLGSAMMGDFREGRSYFFLAGLPTGFVTGARVGADCALETTYALTGGSVVKSSRLNTLWDGVRHERARIKPELRDGRGVLLAGGDDLKQRVGEVLFGFDGVDQRRIAQLQFLALGLERFFKVIGGFEGLLDLFAPSCTALKSTTTLETMLRLNWSVWMRLWL